MVKCEICGTDFEPKNPKRPARTCSKQCKNDLIKNRLVAEDAIKAAIADYKNKQTQTGSVGTFDPNA